MSEGRQLGLFDSPLRGDVSNDRRMMVWGFFALDTSRKSMDPIVYDDGLRRIEVKPSYSGMANVVDKDFIIYIASLMREKMEKGGAAGAEVHLHRQRLLPGIRQGGGRLRL